MNMFKKKTASDKDCITPHKISLLVLISQICERGVEITPFRLHRHGLMLLVLNLIQTTDIDLIELRKKLDEIDVNKGQLSALLCDRLNSISVGESSLCDFFLQNLEDLLNVEEEILLTRTSFFGLFVRKMVLLFNKLSFGQMLHLSESLKSYILSAHTGSITNMNKVMNSDMRSLMPISSYQGETYLAKQAAFLGTYEGDAECPRELQKQINTILCGAPDLAEAHFIQYLNCIRVGEFKQALDYLYHYFDRKKWEERERTTADVEAEDAKKDRCKRFCYAALNLAILHTHFGHRKQALAVLQESIKIAQESNDHICLAHALQLLYKLKEQGEVLAMNILERFCTRASELKVQSLESLSVLMKTKRMISNGEPQSKVWSVFDELNYFHSDKTFLDVCVSINVQQASCLYFYGQSHMAAVFNQLSLHHWKTNHPGQDRRKGMINSDAKLQSLCFLASYLHNQGNFAASMKIFHFTEKFFPENSKKSQTWQTEKAKIIFDQALMMEDWEAASNSVENLKVLDVHGSELRRAKLQTKLKQFERAHQTLRKLMQNLRDYPTDVQDKTCVEELKANILLVFADVYSRTQEYTYAISHLLKCETICEKYHMDNVSIITSLSIAERQFQLGLSGKALYSLQQVMINALSNGSLYTVCCTKLLVSRYQLHQSKDDVNEKRRAVLLSVLSTLDDILKNFKQIHANSKQREVLILQVFIYDELGYIAKRNQSTMEYRLLHTTDEETLKRP